MISPRKNIVKTLERVGYPFKSKEHSLKVGEYKKGSRAKNVIYYKTMQGKSKFACPQSLLYQYGDDFNLKISNKCCYEFKKYVIKDWEKISFKTVVITGMRKSEGGQREKMTCTVFGKGELKKFHPLAVITDKWEDWFIDKYNI